MKRFLIYILPFVFLMNSCSLENDNPENFYVEIMPIQSVEVPESFVHGETYEISVTYSIPNSCYEFNDFIYAINNNERTIAVANTVYTDIVCSDVLEPVTVSFDFYVAYTNTYLFKFYQGVDDEGQDQYLLVEVPVEVEQD